MGITIRPATELDTLSLGQINIASFRHQPFWGNLFPNIPDTEAGTLPLKTARCLDKLVAPNVHVLAAVDDISGRVVGYARWMVPADENGDGKSAVELKEQANVELLNRHKAGNTFPVGTRMDLYHAFQELLKDVEGRLVREGDFVLELLATHPEAQGRGVGTALLNWGLERANKRNARVYLEATEDGYPLYWKYGWRDVEVIEIDFTRFGGEGRQQWTVMVRERGGVVAAA
ncbi:GNAT family N-acetyltransferase [Aspergillus ibericus CBS 121593]|uniref:Acyl-CoA N-acyltransferase n=1 Tax=Aspergillus ibericus CBS 121593 TaxID=1448316 RepID=A0A395GJ30_9EURO|nr:acyl-CoA N-acyltransferase [Aspergillus ibericus CBS 121593]RAK95485.1 acyl-CoA N-acyltransferase [Aspergillus ibericus CBS 121593]